MDDGWNLFHQLVKGTYYSIRKIATGLGHDYTTGSLLDYP